MLQTVCQLAFAPFLLFLHILLASLLSDLHLAFSFFRRFDLFFSNLPYVVARI